MYAVLYLRVYGRSLAGIAGSNPVGAWNLSLVSGPRCKSVLQICLATFLGLAGFI